jgi:hypothetical protein
VIDLKLIYKIGLKDLEALAQIETHAFAWIVMDSWIKLKIFSKNTDK